MKRLLLLGFAAVGLALAPTLSALAMPVAMPGTLGATDAPIVQVKGGKESKGHGQWKHHGGHGPHYGWFKKQKHHKWKHHHRHWW
jgi:hypothetical protein